LINLLILIVDCKVQYAYARNGLTLMMVPMICLWEEIARLKIVRCAQVTRYIANSTPVGKIGR